MPYVAPSTLNDIEKKQRAKLEAAFMERAVLAYAFSWTKLTRMLKAAGWNQDEIRQRLCSCIAAYRDEDEKALREELNETIAGEFQLSGVSTVRHHDPFGRPKDFIVMQGTSTSFSKQTAMDLLVAECKVPAKKIADIWERATSKSKFTTIQARDVREKPEPEDPA